MFLNQLWRMEVEYSIRDISVKRNSPIILSLEIIYKITSYTTLPE